MVREDLEAPLRDLPVDSGDVRGALEDAPPFNDALIAAWAVYLRHYGEKKDSWRRMAPAKLLVVVQKEFAEMESAVRVAAFRHLNHQLRLLTASQVKEALWEIDDTLAALVLLRGRIVQLDEERKAVHEEGYQ